MEENSCRKEIILHFLGISTLLYDAAGVISDTAVPVTRERRYAIQPSITPVQLSTKATHSKRSRKKLSVASLKSAISIEVDSDSVAYHNAKRNRSLRGTLVEDGSDCYEKDSNAQTPATDFQTSPMLEERESLIQEKGSELKTSNHFCNANKSNETSFEEKLCPNRKISRVRNLSHSLGSVMQVTVNSKGKKTLHVDFSKCETEGPISDESRRKLSEPAPVKMNCVINDSSHLDSMNADHNSRSMTLA